MRPIHRFPVPFAALWLSVLALAVCAVSALAAPPVAPGLVAPGDNATNLATTVEFRWNNAGGSTSRTFQIATDDQFATPLYEKTADITDDDGAMTRVTNLEPGTKYFWRVRNTSGAGATAEDGPWAATRNFTVAPADYGTPMLIGPGNNATGVDLDVTLEFVLPANCTGREVQIATKNDFTAGLQKDESDNPSAVFTLQPNRDYWWRVQGKTAGGTTPWSAVWKFKTANQMPAPVLLTPQDRATQVSRPPEMTWKTVNGVEMYLVQIDTVADFSTARTFWFEPTGAGTEMYEPMRLARETTYYWRVVATKGHYDPFHFWVVDVWGLWSNARTFTTSAEPERPTLKSPKNATQVNRPVTITWEAPDEADSYTIQVALDVNFTNKVIDVDKGNITSFRLDTLDQQATYYWRVKAWSNMGDSRWSRVWRFTVLQDPLSAPVLKAPANVATNVALPPSLIWTTTTGATHYDLQVSTYPYFYVGNNTIDVAGSPVSQAPNLSTLAPNTRYYWRVRLLDNVSQPTRTSEWSTTWSFTTGAAQTKPAAPTLTTPTSGAVDVARPVRLTWTVSENATGYKLQIARDAAFTNGLTSATILGGTSTSKDAVSPVASTTYYWRVLAFNNYGSSDWSPVFSFTTAGDPPTTRTTLTAPANGAAGLPTTVTLKWTAVAGATGYTVQYSLGSSFPEGATQTLPVTGLATEVTGLANAAKYFWRVRATNAYGDGPWSSIFSFSTAQAPPDAPLLQSPVNGATDIVRGTESLVWTPAPAISAHKVVVARAADLTQLVHLREVGGTADRVALIDMPLEPATTYYWAVFARNSAGWSAASDVWSFTTTTAAPLAPVPATPANGATNVARPVTLTWNAALRATSYRIEVSASPSFTTPVYGAEVQGTSATPPGLAAGTTYWWRVKAVNVAGESGWTSAWSFITTPALATPALASPLKNAVGVATPVVFTWSSVTGATGYVLQVARTAAFSPVAAEVTAATETATVSGLDPTTTYVWRVKATGTAGGSFWSEPWTFTTRGLTPPPGTPVLVSPVHGSRIGVLPATITWGARTDAQGYDLQVASDAQFTTVVLFEENLTATSRALSGLEYGHRYYWRVRGKGQAEPSAWSTAWSFTTGGPELTAPANAAAGLTGTVVCTWAGTTDAASYAVQVSATEDFQGAPLVDLPAVVGTRAEIAGLALNTTYWWRVRANGAEGASGVWSPSFTFSMLARPAQVTLLAPASGATNLALPLRLTWAAAERATSYIVTIQGMAPATTTGTSFVPAGLKPGQTYTWSVTARNAAGEGDPSGSRTFSTSSTLPKNTYLVSPGNAVAVALPVTLLWAGASTGPTDVVYYWLQVSTTASFANPVINAGELTTNSYKINSLAAGLRYYWRVRTWNAAGQTDWTPYRYFDVPAAVGSAPAVPMQTAPANGAIDLPTPVTLSWGVAAGAEGYALQVASDALFTRFVVNTESLKQTGFAAGNLVSGTQYWWRVKAWNITGASAWSTVRTFTTGTLNPLLPPAAPALLAPADGATGVATLPARLTWNAVTGASSYKVQVSSTADFANLVVHATVAGTAVETAALFNGTTYYWRVAGINDMGMGDWSTVRRFTTK